MIINKVQVAVRNCMRIRKHFNLPIEYSIDVGIGQVGFCSASGLNSLRGTFGQITDV